MKYIPIRNITYSSNLTKEEIVKRLSEINEESGPFWCQFGLLRKKEVGKSYMGHCGDNDFNISRIINYRNSFLPQIIGTFESSSDGTKIKVKFNLHLFVKIFLFIWYCMLASICCFIISSPEKINCTNLPAGIFILIVLWIAPYVMTLVGFNIESSKSKTDLAKLFESDPS